MSKKTMQDLRDAFNFALIQEFPFIAVEVQIDGFPANEIIINKKESIPSKLKYYETNYDDNLQHKHSPSVSIVDFDFADYVDELKWFREDL